LVNSSISALLAVGGVVGEDPGVLGAAALGGVDDEGTFLERDAREAAGHHKNVLAV